MKLPSTDEEYMDANIALAGQAWHLDKLEEECVEVSDALIKMRTKGHDMAHLFEEIGDLEIALAHFYKITGELGRKHIDTAKISKLKLIHAKLDDTISARVALGLIPCPKRN